MSCNRRKGSIYGREEKTHVQRYRSGRNTRRIGTDTPATGQRAAGRSVPVPQSGGRRVLRKRTGTAAVPSGTGRLLSERIAAGLLSETDRSRAIIRMIRSRATTRTGHSRATIRMMDRATIRARETANMYAGPGLLSGAGYSETAVIRKRRKNTEN